MPGDLTSKTLAKWPERIYLQRDYECAEEGCGPHSGDDGETTWCKDKIHDTDVEYVRADLARVSDEPSSVAVNEPVFYRCETCKEIMLAAHLVGTDSHERIEETSEGQPYQVTCGPVRPSVLSAGEYINRFLPANWMNDSSLETWFPITAEELKRLKDERAAQPPTSRLLLVPCPRCFGTGKLKPYKREGDTDWRIDDCPEKHVTAQPPTSAQSSGHEPYWTRSFWSPCRKYLLSVHSYGEREIVAIDDNGNEWEATGPARDIAGDAASLLRQSSTKDAGECGACDKPGEHCANVHGICSRHGGRAHETSVTQENKR